MEQTVTQHIHKIVAGAMLCHGIVFEDTLFQPAATVTGTGIIDVDTFSGEIAFIHCKGVNAPFASTNFPDETWAAPVAATSRYLRQGCILTNGATVTPLLDCSNVGENLRGTAAYTVYRTDGNPGFVADGPAGAFRGMRFHTAGVGRFNAGLNAIAEGGGNAGSNFVINSFSDTGVFIGSAVTIVRSTMDATLGGNLTLAAAKAYQINAVQVVGPRISGWNAPTGTQTRGTLDAAAALGTVAQTLVALIADLRTHGLIGT
jgi:hypothetical protein